MSSDINFTVASLFLGNVHVKPISTHCGEDRGLRIAPLPYGSDSPEAVTKAGKDTPTTLPSTFSRISQPARAINPKKCIIVQCPFFLTPTWQIGFEQKIIMHQVLYSQFFLSWILFQILCYL